jgi:protein-S-isoprenylcysteine O-methyltransferase Ste14
MVLDPLRIYLLAGLLFHKVVWEFMKRRPRSRTGQPLGRRLVKAAKIGILAGVIVQCLLPDVLPISPEPAALRAAGVLLYSIGLGVAVMGRLQLGGNWSDIENAGVLPEQRVVSRGVYRYIRHPIYAGDLCLLAGLELALKSWLVFGALALVPIVYRQAAREEGMLSAQLAGYQQYCRRTKRFIPFVV